MSMRQRAIWGIILVLVITGGIWGGIVNARWSPRLGLDLQGGVAVVLAPRGEAPSDVLEQAVSIIRNRVDGLGVAEPEISRQGNNILIQLPGIRDQERALELIGTTAQLRFRPVLELIPPGAPEYEEAGPADCGDPATYPEDVPGEEVVFCVRDRGDRVRDPLPPDQWVKLRLGPVGLEGEQVADARGTLEPGAVVWFVTLDLTGEGARRFEQLTGELACHPRGDPARELAIVLDRVVESHPQMGDEVQCGVGISGGSAQITGTFTEREAKDLGLVLRYGALPIELDAIATNTVSPTLGSDSLRAGLAAGMLGLAVVFIWVLLFYRGLGLVIITGLGVHAAITIGVITVLGETAGLALTLAGIGGLIAGIGIATDSFIVYFERLRDEMRLGKSVRASVDRAWISARRTIIAADVVTAMAALVLYTLAVGGVRGFALMLGLATALDLVVSFLFMHPVVWLLAQSKRFNQSKVLGIRSIPGTDVAPAVAGGSR